MLNNSRESRHPCRVPHFRGEALSYSLWSMMFAVGFSYMAFIMLRYVPSKPTLLRAFSMNGCYTLSNAFSSSIEMNIWFLSFLLMYHIDWFVNAEDGLPVLEYPERSAKNKYVILVRRK